jgi:hypothetical protein
MRGKRFNCLPNKSVTNTVNNLVLNVDDEAACWFQRFIKRRMKCKKPIFELFRTNS